MDTTRPLHLAVATLLRWVLHLPATALSGPWASAVGCLRPTAPHSLGGPPLRGGTFEESMPEPLLCLLPRHPGPLPDRLQLIYLPDSLLLITSRSALPAIVRRTLDVLMPPPDEHLDLRDWMDDPSDLLPHHPGPATPFDPVPPSSSSSEASETASAASLEDLQ